MLKLYDSAGEAHPLSAVEDLCIVHKLDGCNRMSFYFSTKHDMYKSISEECQIDTDDNEWLVKKIDDDKIECELNFDFLKTRMFNNYLSQTRTITEVLEEHLPSGWTVEGANIVTIRRSIDFEHCTDYDVV